MIFWDIDGTIISLPKVNSERHLESVEFFAKKRLFYRESNLGKTDIGIIRDVFEFNGIRYEMNDLQKCLEILNQRSLIQIIKNDYSINPGVVKSLDYAITHGVTNSVLTGNSFTRAIHKIKLFDLFSKFDLQLGFFGDSHFTRGDLVRFAKDSCKKSEVKRFILIGDTLIDIDAAKKNGVDIAAVSTGKDSYLDLKSHKPNWVLKDFEKDHRLFQNIINDLTRN